MKTKRLVRELTACSMAIALAGAAPTALAGDDQPKRGMTGPGMMDGYGPQANGPCMPNGYGPGMMHGNGMMPGYGPGMMPGYGSGMMPGYGPGMMPGYGAGSSNLGRLTEGQQERLREIQQEAQEERWDQIREMQERHREFYRLQLADEPDYEAIKEKSREISELRQEMMEQHINTQKKMREALEQN